MGAKPGEERYKTATSSFLANSPPAAGHEDLCPPLLPPPPAPSFPGLQARPAQHPRQTWRPAQKGQRSGDGENSQVKLLYQADPQAPIEVKLTKPEDEGLRKNTH